MVIDSPPFEVDLNGSINQTGSYLPSGWCWTFYESIKDGS